MVFCPAVSRTLERGHAIWGLVPTNGSEYDKSHAIAPMQMLNCAGPHQQMAIMYQLTSTRLWSRSAGTFDDPTSAVTWMTLQSIGRCFQVHSIDNPGQAFEVRIEDVYTRMDQDSGKQTAYMVLATSDPAHAEILAQVVTAGTLLPICNNKNALHDLVICSEQALSLTTKNNDWPPQPAQRMTLVRTSKLIQSTFKDAEEARNWAKSIEVYPHGVRATAPVFFDTNTDPIGWIENFGANTSAGGDAELTGEFYFDNKEWHEYGQTRGYVASYCTRSHFLCSRLLRAERK